MSAAEDNQIVAAIVAAMVRRAPDVAVEAGPWNVADTVMFRLSRGGVTWNQSVHYDTLHATGAELSAMHLLTNLSRQERGPH